MTRQKVLVTGNCGFIFSNFVRKVLYENAKYPYDVVSIDKIVRSTMRENVYVNKNNQFHIGDIADEHFINLIFDFEKPDIVINGAAESHVDNSLKDPNVFIHSNVLGTQVLLNASVKYGIKKFVQISTDEVMGHLTSDKDPLLTEDAPLNPRNPYSASKASAELLVKAAHESFGLNYIITRSSNNYGPRQTADKFIPKVIKCVLNNEKIPVYGEGKQIRDWLYVNDNCDGILKILQEDKINETYNISANQEYSNIEVVQMICNLMGKGWDLIEFVKDRPGHDFRYGIDSSKLKQLGWSPKIKFKDGKDVEGGLAKTIKWYLLNTYALK